MTLERFGHRMLITLMLTIITWGAWSCMGPSADAACKPPKCIVAEQWTPAARLQVARALWGECGPECAKHPDASAIPHIFVKRWKQRVKVEPGVTLAQVATRYAKPLRARHERGRRVQSLPWGPLEGPLSKHSADWIAILVHVGRVARGEVSDPCPRAMHYWGPMDAQPESFVRVCRRVRARNRLGRRRV
jgi:hypothetical protein